MKTKILSDFIEFLILKDISIIEVMEAYYEKLYHHRLDIQSGLADAPKTNQQKHPEYGAADLHVLQSCPHQSWPQQECALKVTKSESIDEVSPSVMSAADDMQEKKADIEFHCPAEDQNVPGYVNLNYQGPFTPEEYHLKLQDGGTILDVIESKGMTKGVYKKRRVRGSNIIDALSKPVQLRKNNAASFTLGQLSNIMKMNFQQLLELIHEGSFPGPDVDNNRWSLKKLQTIPEFLKNYRAGEE